MPTILLIGPYRFYFYSHEPIPFVTQDSAIGWVQSAKNRSPQSGLVSLNTTHFAAIDFWQLSIPSNSRVLSHERYNEPPHVHVDREGYSAKFWLKKVSLANNLGFAKKELIELHDLVNKNQKQFLDKWHAYFSTKN